MIKYIRRMYFGLKYGLPDRLDRLKFLPALNNIVNTPPIFCRNDGLVILTMVSHKDTLMYLLAAKSLGMYLKRGRFEVLNDGSLTEEDITLIMKHIQGVQFADFKKVNNTKCPKKGCWERLIYASELSQKEQVFVIDSDILIHGDISEVHNCINRNQNFIVGIGQEIQPMLNVWAVDNEKCKNLDPTKLEIQQYFDANLNLVPECEKLKYLKATAGFNGFAKGVISRDLVEEWSAKMEEIFGKFWHKWGSEQIMACFLVANYGDTVVLQEPKYGLYYAEKDIKYDAMSIIHFIGSHRFKKGYYAKATRRVIKRLKNG